MNIRTESPRSDQSRQAKLSGLYSPKRFDLQAHRGRADTGVKLQARGRQQLVARQMGFADGRRSNQEQMP